MKEETSSPRENGLPSCSLSGYCIFVADELEHAHEQDAVLFTGDDEDTHDQQIFAQMHAHLPNCPTCSSTLSQLRKERDQQRTLLQTFLAQGEQTVPSTVASILANVRGIQQTPQPLETPLPTALSANNHHDSQLAAEPLLMQKSYPFGQVQRNTRPERRRTARWVRMLLTVAAVLVFLLGSLTLFSRLIAFHGGGSASSTSNGTSGVQMLQSWSSVVMTVVSNNQLLIGNYDPLSGKYSELGRSDNPATTVVDGVAHNGYALLYHSYDGKQTVYRVVPQNITLYTVQGRAGSAVWSTDDRFIFISTQQGIVQIDAANSSAKLVWPKTTSPGTPVLDIHFYRDGYLYVSMPNQAGTTGALQRVALRDKTVQTVASCANMHDFWLSPYGATVYYACGDQDALYAVNSDGTSPRLFRTHAGRIIGFAQDDALITLSLVNTVSRVLKLGSNPALDQVLLTPLAPQAAPIMAQDVAVAPYGTALVVKSIYHDDIQKMWYGNLLNGQQQIMPITTGVVQLIGWSRLQVPATTPLVQATQPLTLDAWHQVLMVHSTLQGVTLVNDDVHNDASTVLSTPTGLPASTLVDGIAGDGKNVLYQFSRAGHTLYYTLSPVAKTGYFYALNNQDAGNAIWSSDSEYVLVNTIHNGVSRVNVQTGEVVDILPHLKAAKLIRYRAPYLYFLGAEDRATGALYRVNLNQDGAVPQQVTLRSTRSTFWLSPDGNTVYYVNTGSAGKAGVYAVKSDGSNFATAQPLRTGDVPIGYGADNALMMIRQVQGRFQVVKLGATTPQDQVVLADVAPGAISLCDTAVAVGMTPICDSSVALAPLGGKLVVEAGYADGSHALWSIDLATGARFQLPTPVSTLGEQWQLLGWNQIVPRNS